MTHSLRLTVVVCAGVLALNGASSQPRAAAADTPVVVVQASRIEPRAGEWVDFYVTVASSDPTLTAVVDPLGVAEGFVRRMWPSEVALCREGRSLQATFYPDSGPRTTPMAKASATSTSTAAAPTRGRATPATSPTRRTVTARRGSSSVSP
jgi:hypothetical protein